MKLFRVTVKGSENEIAIISHVVCNNLSEIESLISTTKGRTQLGFSLTEELDVLQTVLVADTMNKLILGEEKETTIKTI